MTLAGDKTLGETEAKGTLFFAPRSVPILWVRYLSLAISLAFTAIIVFQPFVEPVWMFYDPLTAAEQSGDCCHTYYGFVSYLGIMLWVATAAVCLFSALLILLTRQNQSFAYFSLAAGLLAGWLALDDAFLLHELVLPNIGVPQNMVLGVYTALALAYILVGWRVVLSADIILLGFAGVCLAASIFIDIFVHEPYPQRVYWEDGAKFVGIFCWASFHISTLLNVLVKQSRQ